jgi:carboxypeptidase C (cathepsin A)
MYSVLPEKAHSITDLNKEQITIDFVEGSHMVPNEDPDALGKHITFLADK